MAKYKRGKSSFLFSTKPVIAAWASIAGKKESEGPLRTSFDKVFTDTLLGQKTWEQAEKKMQELCLRTLAEKAALHPWEIDLVFSGDLLNQCIGSSFSLRNMNIPHLGLYGSSHFASSERQYRFPLGYGGQRTPTAQWTVTGSGAALVCSEGHGPRLTCGTVGTVRDLGIKDACNMGAAMAPAALSTIQAHLEDMKRTPKDYDLIVTGDLGQLGKDLLLELASREGLELGGKLEDCGTLVFDNTRQDVHAGGSGCGCSAITLCGHLLGQLETGKLKRILFCGTGALLSPISTQQGLPIPGVCHAVAIEGGES